MKTIITLLFLVYTSQVILPSTYRVKYNLIYQPDSTNSKRVASENFFLYLHTGESSMFGSEGRFKSDSVRALIKKGVLPENAQLDGQNRFKTNFKYFVCKDYAKVETIVYESISTDRFTYAAPSTFNWKIMAEQDSVAGYFCTKATANHAGRDYEAWFTTDIPISDGPYIFRGLPGLIVKLYDSRNHYVFMLQSFQEFKGERTLSPTYISATPIRIDQEKIISIRSEFRKGALEYMSRRNGVNFKSGTFATPDGVTKPAMEARVDRSWDNNPLELK